MTLNFPGPYEFRISYLYSGVTHEMRLNFQTTGVIDPGTPFDEIDVLQANSGSIKADVAMSTWLALIDGLWAASCTLGPVEIWRYFPESFVATFISAAEYAVVGTNGGSNNAARQDTLTFRTIEGGILKLNFLETAKAQANGVFAATGGDGDFDAIVNFVLDGTNWILGRDTSYPIAGLHYLTGQNEKTFRQRYRA